MKEYLDIVLESIEYMEVHLEEKCSIQEVADHVHFSKFHFIHIFQEITGQNVGEYFFRRRLTNAAETLQTNNVGILEVALRCGYNSQEAFTRAFKDYFEMTPAKYRSLNRNLSNLFCYPLVRDNLNPLQEDQIIQYDLVGMDEITIIGLEYTGSNKKKELSKLINSFLQQMYQQKQLDIDAIKGMFGYQCCTENQNSEDEFYYMIGVKKEETISGLGRMKEITIPANLYAHFHLSSRIERLHAEIGQAYRALLKEGIYRPVQNYAFEYYDKAFLPNDPYSHTDFYVVVEKTVM